MNHFSTNRGYRLLNLYERLSKGEEIRKQALAREFGVTEKTIQRDIDELRAYLADAHPTEGETAIRFSRAKGAYYLVRKEREWLTNTEALAICKILLESRALNKPEMQRILGKIILQISPKDRDVAEAVIRSELLNYLPPHHGKDLLDVLWTLSEHITEKRVITFEYARQDGKKSRRAVKPVAIMFNEFYFYLIVYGFEVDHPLVFRIDRMEKIAPTGERFEIPYKKRFSDGEFRRRVLFMYSGALQRVTFEYSGVPEAMLDKVPTAKILSQKDGVCIMEAEAFGDGLLMWLNAQGEKVKILSKTTVSAPF